MAEEVQGISGACMMLRRDVYIRVGCFSEDYFMYTEDLDLCYKTRKSGLKNYYLAEAATIHFGGSSSRQAASDFSCIMMRESIWRFLRKTRGDIYGLGYRCAMFLSAVVRLGLLVFLSPSKLCGVAASAGVVLFGSGMPFCGGACAYPCQV